MFGRMMNETLGKIHFWLTFIFFNGTFFPMHILGIGGLPAPHRRLHELQLLRALPADEPVHQHTARSAWACARSRSSINFIGSWIWGKKAPQQPVGSDHAGVGDTDQPPAARQLRKVPVVHHGPYEYSSPLVEEDWLPQTRYVEGQKIGGQSIDDLTTLLRESGQGVQNSRSAQSNLVTRSLGGESNEHDRTVTIRPSTASPCSPRPRRSRSSSWAGWSRPTAPACACPTGRTAYGYNMFTLPAEPVDRRDSLRAHAPADGHRRRHAVDRADDHRLEDRTAPMGALARNLRVLVAVIFQGVLGGLRVVLVKLDLAIVHACFAQAFFCLAAFAAPSSRRGGGSTPSRHTQTSWPRSIASDHRLRVCAIVIFSSTHRRRNDAPLRSRPRDPGFPARYGHVLPPSLELALNDQRRITMDASCPPVDARQIWLHFAHRIGAAIVTIIVAHTSITSILRRRNRPGAAPTGNLCSSHF